MRDVSFDFGKNWGEFSSVLTPERVEKSRRSLEVVFGPDGLRGRTFLDIGCGSGVFSICASRLGAKKIVGIDVDPECIEVSRKNSLSFIGQSVMPEFLQISILDGEKVKTLEKSDVVYAWGSLHHTGNMWRAIKITTDLVDAGGTLWLAIYHRHFTSPIWKEIKRTFNFAPRAGKRVMTFFFYGIIFSAVLFKTRKNPLEQKRGMSFRHDVVDWIGGYPYEYASPREVIEYVTNLGFSLQKFIKTIYLTGNNEYVFKKI